ncbi:MAG TPA: 3-phosphoshikimate 1-carboxyvinyltransferase [Candidatus Polarisedimenticolia bacterium]|nr:3-phosphoshikimate 1-carboxyvinyltransferase [Candidatus Polarisedimenticolia bacterium]
MPSSEREIPVTRRLGGGVLAPPSKSVTQRALIAAALARGRSRLRNPLLADDSNHLIAALNAVGIRARVTVSGDEQAVEVEGRGGEIPASAATLTVGNAGTAMRFLTAVLALGRGRYVIDGDPRMRERPIEDLLLALRALGGSAESLPQNGCPPVRVGGGLLGGSARLGGSRSSQYLSAILLAAPAAPAGVMIEIEGGLVSRPYVDLTIGVMSRFGVAVEQEPPAPRARRYTVRPGGVYEPRDIAIEGDYSSASYFFAAAAVTGGRVEVSGLDPDSAQGDAGFLDLLRLMGCRITKGQGVIAVEGPGNLAGIEADCGMMPDIVPTLAVVALFAGGPTTVRGVPHLRIKETDRIAALVTEIRRLGGEAEPQADGLRIVPRPLRGAAIETYGDHRMAMAFAVAGLALPGVVIRDPGCVAKSFPGFWDLLDRLISRPC